MSLKQHHHTLLVTFFLIGALLVFGSFEARLPDSVRAASTPGQQSVQKSADWQFNFGQPDDHNYAAKTQVNYAGEVRDKSSGALITSDTKLKPGDIVTLDIYAESSYLIAGGWIGSPPAPWVGDDFLQKLLPSGWTYKTTMVNAHTWSWYSTPVLSAPEVYVYESSNFLDTSPVIAPIGPNYCSPNDSNQVGISAAPACMQTSVKKPAVDLNTNGMICAPLTQTDTSNGAMKYSTTCTITTSGPQATVSANIGATKFYYPMRVREFAWYGNNGISLPSGFSYVTVSVPASQQNDEGPMDPGGSYQYSKVCHEEISDNGPISVCDTAPVAGNFYAPGTIDAATLSWNIDVAPEQIPAPTLTFVGNPTTINQGQSSTLTWSSQNTTSCAAPEIATAEMGYWTGPKPTSGSQPISPLNPGTYVHNLTCVGPGGSVSGNVTITVNPVCSAGQTSPYNTCQSSSCVSVNSCGASSCTSNADCSPLAATCSVSPTSITAAGQATWTASASGGTGVYSYVWSGHPEINGVTGQSVTKNYSTTQAEGVKTKTASVAITSGGQNIIQACSNSLTIFPEGPPPGFSCNSQGQCQQGGGGASCGLTVSCPTGGDGGTCTSNCGGGGGGGGGGGSSPIIANPTANPVSSDTSFFCPSHQVALNWNYSSPINSPQTTFKLQIDDNSDFSSMALDTYQDSSQTTYVVPTNVLNLGTKYYFEVIVKDAAGNWSTWAKSDFTTPASCAPPPDFGLNSSNNISVNVTGVGSGTSNSSQITVSAFSGFNAAVNLSVQSTSPNLPGASYSLAPSTLPQNKYSSGSNFTVTVPGTAVPGNYTITIQGTGAGLNRTVNVILHVNSTSPIFREI